MPAFPRKPIVLNSINMLKNHDTPKCLKKEDEDPIAHPTKQAPKHEGEAHLHGEKKEVSEKAFQEWSDDGEGRASS